MGVLTSKPDFGLDDRPEATRLNEMKVAEKLLRLNAAILEAASLSEAPAILSRVEQLASIAGILAAAPHLYREDAVQAIADVVATAAGLDELRDEVRP